MQRDLVTKLRVQGTQIDENTRAADELRQSAKSASVAMKAQLQEQLQELLQSSVRLCVVAPTVNVSFGGQTLSHKAPLPREKIRAALELQVLPSFTRAFTQEHENMAPDGGSMDDWLKETTVSMQGSIEKHLSKVFAA